MVALAEDRLPCRLWLLALVHLIARTRTCLGVEHAMLTVVSRYLATSSTGLCWTGKFLAMFFQQLGTSCGQGTDSNFLP